MSDVYFSTVKKVTNTETGNVRYYILMNGEYWERMAKSRYESMIQTSNWSERDKPTRNGNLKTEITKHYFQIQTKH